MRGDLGMSDTLTPSKTYRCLQLDRTSISKIVLWSQFAVDGEDSLEKVRPRDTVCAGGPRLRTGVSGAGWAHGCARRIPVSGLANAGAEYTANFQRQLVGGLQAHEVTHAWERSALHVAARVLAAVHGHPGGQCTVLRAPDERDGNTNRRIVDRLELRASLRHELRAHHLAVVVDGPPQIVGLLKARDQLVDERHVHASLLALPQREG